MSVGPDESGTIVLRGQPGICRIDRNSTIIALRTTDQTLPSRDFEYSSSHRAILTYLCTAMRVTECLPTGAAENEHNDAPKRAKTPHKPPPEHTPEQRAYEPTNSGNTTLQFGNLHAECHITLAVSPLAMEPILGGRTGFGPVRTLSFYSLEI